MYMFVHILKMQMNICLRDLPTRKKSRLPSRAPTHAYADCEISGQQPTQLYKEFPRVHEVGHSKKKRCSSGEKENHLQHGLFRGYVSSQEGIYIYISYIWI